MFRTLYYEQSLGPACRPANPAVRLRQPRWPVLTTPVSVFGGLLAVFEGLAAYRRFERLRSRGIAHNTALRRALGIGVSPRAE